MWAPVSGEVTGKGFGEVHSGRAERGGDGTDSGLGDEQSDRGRCCGDEEGSSLGGLGGTVLGKALGDVVRAMGDEEGEDSLCVTRAMGLELAAKPVDWMTLKCCSVRGLELCKASGAV